MIRRIEGRLTAVGDGSVEIACGAFTYEVLVPAHDLQRLGASIGETVVFHTLHHLEAQGQGTSFIPRLVGFATPGDRAFFTLFTTVKGLGNRKGLRALQLPIPTVAAAIAAGDLDVLTSLPEIGKRTAQTIVAELHGKIDRFVEVKPVAVDADDPRRALLTDATAVLVQLGEPRATARQLVERAAHADPDLATADALVAAAFRLRELP